MNKINICRIAQWASEELGKCSWWKPKRKKFLFEIIFEAYKDITN